MSSIAKWNSQGCMKVLRIAHQRKVGNYSRRYRMPQPKGACGSSDFKHGHYISAIGSLQLVCADNGCRSLVAFFACGCMSEVADKLRFTEQIRSRRSSKASDPMRVKASQSVLPMVLDDFSCQTRNSEILEAPR